MINTKFLHGTRFLLALWVLLGHFYQMVGQERFINLSVVGKLLLTNGSAVDGFIVITGFLMVYNLIKRGDIEPCHEFDTAKKFYLRRFFRLYPVYFIIIILAFFACTTESIYRINIMEYFTGSNLSNGSEMAVKQPDLLCLLSTLSLTHGLIPKYSNVILPPSWSLSLEAQFYILLPLIFYVFFHKSRTRSIPVLAALCAVIALASPKIFGLYYTNTGAILHYFHPSILVYKMPLFILGMVLACVGLEYLSYRHLIALLLIVLPTQWIMTNMTIVLLILFMYLDYCKEIIPSRLFGFLTAVRSILSGKWATAGADISYSIYLIHRPAMAFVTWMCINNLGDVLADKRMVMGVSLLITLILVICTSYLIYEFIEKRFIALGKNLIDKTVQKARPIKPARGIGV